MRNTFIIISIIGILAAFTSCEFFGSLPGNQANKNRTDILSDSTGNDSPEHIEPPYLLRYMFATGEIPSDLMMVEERISELTLDKINVDLELIPVSFGAFDDKFNLMIASGEQLDIIFQRGRTLSHDVARGLLTPLDELLHAYGQGIKHAVGDYLKATTIDGETYAVPTIRDMAASYGLVVRKDILDKYGIDVAAIETVEDVEDMFGAVESEEPELIITMPQIAGTQTIMTTGFMTWDSLGDSLGVLMNHGSELRVVNLFETEEYRRNLDIIRRWYLKGYIWEDSSISGDHANILAGAGKLFSYFSNLKPGFDRQESLRAGRELVTIELKPPFSTTSQVALVSMSIPSTSRNTQKAMQFLNLMYTDPEIINLFHWGIENVHYVRVPDTLNLIRFPQNVNALTSGYNLALGWQFGNQLLSYIWEGNNPYLYSEMADFNEQAIRSLAMGFTFDSSMLNHEIAAISNVIARYRAPLENGALDPETKLPEFIVALRKAGIDRVIAEKQMQLDEWALGMD